MQPAKDRIDTDGIRFSAAMARIWTWVFKIGERWVGNTGTQLCSAIIRVSDYSVDLESRCDPWHD
jgi:hypothetical protein